MAYIICCYKANACLCQDIAQALNPGKSRSVLPVGQSFLLEHGLRLGFRLFELHNVGDGEAYGHPVHVVVRTHVGKAPSLILQVLDERLDGLQGVSR